LKERISDWLNWTRSIRSFLFTFSVRGCIICRLFDWSCTRTVNEFDVLTSAVLRSTANMTDGPTLSVTLLGAGQEVGRSCCVLQYRGKTIVCDAGVHPAYSGMASLPFVDELDWSTVDAILVTQLVSAGVYCSIHLGLTLFF
jgi:predicted metal-dependent RNase